MIRVHIETDRTDAPAEMALVAEDLDAEVAAFNTWFRTTKGAEPLTSYERGILRTYLIYLLNRDENASTESPV